MAVGSASNLGDRRVFEVSAPGQRTVGLERHASLPAAGEQAAAKAERAEVDLVDRRRDPARIDHLGQLVEVEVADSDRPGQSALQRRLHPLPGPGGPTLRPVDQVQVEAVCAEALQAALSLDDTAYRAMCARARQFAEYMFSPQSVAAATRAVYTSLLARDT